jgi:transposase-like protein
MVGPVVVEITARKEIPTMTTKQATTKLTDVQQILGDDPDFLRPLVQGLVQEALEAEMATCLGRQG